MHALYRICEGFKRIASIAGKTLLSMVIVYSYHAYAANFEAIRAPSFQVAPSKKNLPSYKKASTLVVGCVDFRLRDEIESFVRETLYLTDDYDEMTLPGASLAFVDDTHPHWAQTMEEVIGILKTLHDIKRVIFIDHMECGAYALLKGQEAVKTPALEAQAHSVTLRKAKEKMHALFPELEVYAMLMDLNGHIIQIQ